jgi:hypothetical protein
MSTPRQHPPTRPLLILTEALLILATLGLITACWLPIDRFRHWVQDIF